MTLSLGIIIILPLFIIPVVLLPINRIRFFLGGTLIAFFLTAIIYLTDAFFPTAGLGDMIGSWAYPIFRFLIEGHIELNTPERYHISFCLFLFILYLTIYLIYFLFGKIFFVGNNPSFNRKTTKLRKAFDGFIFILTTYIGLIIILINIRMILPFSYGVLNPLFNWIYTIGA